MKKIVISSIVAASLALGSGIPVVDAAANAQMAQQNAQTIATWAKEAERWVKTATHYQSQLEAYKNQLLSQTGIRDVVSFTKDLQQFENFSKQYKKDFLSIGNDVLNSNSPIGSKAKELFEKYNLYDDCNIDFYTAEQKTNCKNKMVRRVQEIATYQEYSKTLDHIGDNISNLSNKLTYSKDIKESQDIANALQAQIAQLNLTKTQIELMNAQNVRLDAIELRQNEQLMQKRRQNPDTVNYNY